MAPSAGPRRPGRDRLARAPRAVAAVVAIVLSLAGGGYWWYRR